MPWSKINTCAVQEYKRGIELDFKQSNPSSLSTEEHQGSIQKLMLYVEIIFNNMNTITILADNCKKIRMY